MANPADPFPDNQLTLDPRFQWTFKVLSSIYMDNPSPQTELDCGGKVILPQRALELLSDYPEVLQRPIQFRVSVTNVAIFNPFKITHCGVLEFTAPLNTVFMPGWMMDYLGVHDHSLVNFERALLPKATYCKFQPQSSSFLDISNPKAMLERSLRRFACLTRGDILTIQYNNHEYKLLVQETLPSPSVSIIDCDMETEFAEPPDYQPPPLKKIAKDSEDEDKSNDTQKNGSEVSSAFQGPGYRLNRKTPLKGRPVAGARKNEVDLTWKIGALKFKR